MTTDRICYMTKVDSKMVQDPYLITQCILRVGWEMCHDDRIHANGTGCL